MLRSRRKLVGLATAALLLASLISVFPGLVSGSTVVRPANDPARAMEKIDWLRSQGPDRGRFAAESALQNSNPQVRAYAVQVLSELGTDEQISALYQVAAADPDPQLRSAAEEAALQVKIRLSGNDEGKLLSVLAPALQSQNRAVRLRAAGALAGGRSEQAARMVRKHLQTETDEAVRRALSTK